MRRLPALAWAAETGYWAGTDSLRLLEADQLEALAATVIAEKRAEIAAQEREAQAIAIVNALSEAMS